ncbi:MAG TPA: HAMP domain-containing sensor histidine kinase [Acidimicrobiia bacterium]|nr:HAMP domain-containing sensor histidine kinase [Acidimicrobiia bacterium]
MRSADIRPRSTWWLVVSGVIWALAMASLLAAVIHQRSATRPIGEWEVFLEDAGAAALILQEDSDGEGVRHARNHLGIEAVSVVDASGIVVSSTSGTLARRPVANQLLAAGVSNGRFTGLAAATAEPIEIDGVVEWPVGAVLYQVLSPIEDGEFVMLHYDVSDLLARRAQPGAIDPLTTQLLALGGVFVLLGAVVFIGHSRATRRHREMATESELLRKHSLELEEANVELAMARRKAEQALALAEEKMRIRSEFVLMINHELRTPLTSVVTGAELMRDGDLGPDDRRDLIDSMVTHGKRLGEIIDQILAVARIENLGLTYELESVPLETVCAAIDSPVAAVADPAEVAVRTDVRTLALVVSSLAENARTHGAENVGVECHLESRLQPMFAIGEQPREALFITVADDGPGIDPGFLPRAFEKFEKNSFSSGTGLGLYLVRLMMDALDGSISVDTSPSGTTFELALPATVRQPAMEAV